MWVAPIPEAEQSHGRFGHPQKLQRLLRTPLTNPTPWGSFCANNKIFTESQNRSERKGPHWVTCSHLPAQAGSPQSTGLCPEGSGISLVREAPHPPQSSLELQVLSDAQALPVPDSKSRSHCQAVRV